EIGLPRCARVGKRKVSLPGGDDGATVALRFYVNFAALLRNCFLPFGQPRCTLALCVGLLTGQFLCRGWRCSADFWFHGFSSYVCRMHWVGGCTRMPLSAVGVSRDLSCASARRRSRWSGVRFHEVLVSREDVSDLRVAGCNS